MPNRQPAGSPASTGGQFAPGTNPASAVELGVPVEVPHSPAKLRQKAARLAAVAAERELVDASMVVFGESVRSKFPDAASVDLRDEEYEWDTWAIRNSEGELLAEQGNDGELDDEMWEDTTFVDGRASSYIEAHYAVDGSTTHDDGKLLSVTLSIEKMLAAKTG